MAPNSSVTLLEHLVFLDVAGHDQRGVIRGVIRLVELPGILKGPALDLAGPADGRPPVGVGHEGGGPHHLAQGGGRLILDPEAPLLVHHVPLRQELLLLEQDVHHPVRLEFQAEVDAIRGEVLVVGRGIPRRVGVILAAVALHNDRELLGPGLGRPLEHHVFHHVGEAALAQGLVPRPGLVPDLDGHHGGLGLLDQEHLEAVGQGRLRSPDPRWSRRQRAPPTRRRAPAPPSTPGIAATARVPGSVRLRASCIIRSSSPAPRLCIPRSSSLPAACCPCQLPPCPAPLVLPSRLVDESTSPRLLLLPVSARCQMSLILSLSSYGFSACSCRIRTMARRTSISPGTSLSAASACATASA